MKGTLHNVLLFTTVELKSSLLGQGHLLLILLGDDDAERLEFHLERLESRLTVLRLLRGEGGDDLVGVVVDNLEGAVDAGLDAGETDAGHAKVVGDGFDLALHVADLLVVDGEGVAEERASVLHGVGGEAGEIADDLLGHGVGGGGGDDGGGEHADAEVLRRAADRLDGAETIGVVLRRGAGRGGGAASRAARAGRGRGGAHGAAREEGVRDGGHLCVCSAMRR